VAKQFVLVVDDKWDDTPSFCAGVYNSLEEAQNARDLIQTAIEPESFRHIAIHELYSVDRLPQWEIRG
jgi:4-hydroxy-3-methylbut-2-enyl diphosphate reductase IspH